MSELSREAVSRRQFLTGLGAVTTTVVGGLAFDVWGRALPAVASTANGSAKPQGTLVIVELGGGNDGLNTVVPHGDPTYRALRPTLGITDAIDLDGEIGLHPKLARLAARYSAGQVAIIEGIGYPEPDLSHFASMAYWWSGEPHGPSSSGWIGRYLDTAVGFDDPLAGLAIGPGPHGALVGDRSFSASLVNASGLQPRLPAWAGTCLA